MSSIEATVASKKYCLMYGGELNYDVMISPQVLVLVVNLMLKLSACLAQSSEST